MRQSGFTSSSTFRWVLFAIATSIFAAPVAFGHSFRPVGALKASLEILVALGIALFAIRVPRQALRRLGAMRRERALFRSMAARSRQASLVCEPVRAPGGAITDFRILYTNRRGAKLLTPDAGQGKSLMTLLPREEFTATMETWTRVLRTGQAEVAKLAVRGLGTDKGVCEVHVVPQSGCLVLTTLQSREEKAAQRQVEELHDFTRAVFESAPVSIIATDASGVIIAMNEGAEKLTRYRKHELIGKHSLLRLHDPEEVSQRSVVLRRALGRQMGEVELLIEHRKRNEKEDWTYVRRDGSKVCVHVTLTPLHTDGGLSGYLAVAFDVTERKQLADTAFYMAHHDQLTGLPNRTLVNSTIETAVEHAKDIAGTVAVFVVDIDHFKRINDSLGHAGGDTVLTTVAARVLASIRCADFAARLGGDEFVLVFPDMRSAANAEMRAKALLDAISRPFQVGAREICVTASIGYCLYPDCTGSAEDLLRQADLAMYAAKTSGRGRFAPFSEELQRTTQGRLEMEEDLRHALERGEFSLHYQPQVSCSSGSVESVEMLLRWNSSKRGNVPPNVFIPIAQEAGLMFEIGAWSLKKACHDCVAAHGLLHRRFRVAVNLSAEQIREPELFHIVETALSESGLQPADLELEITEEMLMSGSPDVFETLDRIRELGVSLAIDDFGTGFSSFSYLLQYHVDRLKIDRSFVSQVVTDTNAAAIVRTVVAMAHNLGLKVCAEGAETEAQIDFLMRRRCDEIQGFFFAKPVPFSELRDTVLKVETTSRQHSRAAAAAKRHVTIPFPVTTVSAEETKLPRLQA